MYMSNKIIIIIIIIITKMLICTATEDVRLPECDAVSAVEY